MGQDVVWREPIDWIDLDGVAVTDPHKASHPFMTVNVTAVGQTKFAQMRALIDTGASHTILHSDVLVGLGASPNGQKEMTGNWSKTTQDTYRICISVVACPQFILTTDATELASFADQFNPRAVVGVDFLRFGRLVLDPNGESYFELRSQQLLRMTGSKPPPELTRHPPK